MRLMEFATTSLRAVFRLRNFLALAVVVLAGVVIQVHRYEVVTEQGWEGRASYVIVLDRLTGETSYTVLGVSKREVKYMYEHTGMAGKWVSLGKP